MIKCYHSRRIELVIDSEPQLFFQGPLITPLIAAIDSDKEELEDIWDCCNNSCWYDRKSFRQMKKYKDKFRVRFTKDYSGYCNDDLIVEMGCKFFVSRSCGWTDFDTFDDAVRYCRDHSFWCYLNGKNKQHPIGREGSVDELKNLAKEYTRKGIHARILKD